MFLLKLIYCVILSTAISAYANDALSVFSRMEKAYRKIYKLPKREPSSQRKSSYETLEEMYLSGRILTRIEHSTMEGICVTKDKDFRSSIRIWSKIDSNGKKKFFVKLKEEDDKTYSPIIKQVPNYLPLSMYIKGVFNDALYFEDTQKEFGYGLRNYGSKIILKKACIKYKGCSNKIKYGETIGFCYFFK